VARRNLLLVFSWYKGWLTDWRKRGACWGVVVARSLANPLDESAGSADIGSSPELEMFVGCVGLVL